MTAPATTTDDAAGALRYWEPFYLLVLLGTLAYLLLDEGYSTASDIGAVGCLAALALWYWFMGHPLMSAKRVGLVPSLVYTAGAVLLYGAAVAITDDATWLIPALISQLFWLLEMRFAIPAVVLVCVLPAVAPLLRSVDYNILSALPTGLISGALALLIGYFMSRFTDQNQAQADLIQRLEASQSKVAKLSHEAGIAAERDRLSREIHDTLAQGFASIVTLAEAIQSEMDSDPAAARRHLDLAARTARENLAEARAIVAAQTPASLASAGLTEAVRRQADRLAEEASVEVRFTADEALPSLGTAKDVVLLRAAQEALHNIRKHAGATLVDIRLSRDGDRIRLTVTDDGAGFDADRTGDGFGLHGMRARTEQVGGKLTVRSSHGEGATVRVEVPA